MTDTSSTILIIFLIAIVVGLLIAFVWLVWRMSRTSMVEASPSDQSATESSSSAEPAKREWMATESTSTEWITTEYDLTRLPPDLSQAAWAGAIPHAFDANVLRAVAPELAGRVGATYLEVQKLSFVEAAPDNQHCIHAPTRAKMLDHLWRTDQAAYRYRAAQAARYYSQLLYAERGGWRAALGWLLYRYVLPRCSRPAVQIEWLYHLAIADPEAAVTALRFLATAWTAEQRHDEVDKMLLILGEHLDAGRASKHLAGTVYYFNALAERRKKRLPEALGYLQRARRDAGHDHLLLHETLAVSGEVHNALNRSEAVPRHDAAVWAAYRVWVNRLGVVRRQWRWWHELHQIDRRDEAMKHHQELLAIYRNAHNFMGEAHTSRVMADEYLFLDRPVEALHWYEAAQRLYRRAGSHFDEAATQHALGDLQHYLGRYDEAQRHYAEALTGYRNLNARLAEADVLQANGDMQLALHNPAAALDQYDEARTLYHEHGAPLSEAAVLVAMGNALTASGRIVAAQSRYDGARQLYTQYGDRLGEANVSLASGDQQRHMGRLDEAARDYDQALKLYQHSRDRLGEANTLLALGRLAGVQNRGGDAVRQITAALETYRAIDGQLGEANALVILGEEYRRTDKLVAANAQFEAAQLIYAAIGQLRGEAEMHLAQGRLLIALNDPGAAAQHFDQARIAYEKLGYLPGQAAAWLALGAHSLSGDYAAAQTQLTSALNLYKQAKDYAQQLAVLTLLAEVQIGLKQRAAAVDLYQQAIDLLINLPLSRREGLGVRGRQALADDQFDLAVTHLEPAVAREQQSVWQWQFDLAVARWALKPAAEADALARLWPPPTAADRAHTRRWLAYVRWLKPDLPTLPDEWGGVD